MGPRSLAILLLLTLAALGLLAGQDGFRPFVPSLLEGASVTVRLALAICGVAVIAAAVAGIARAHAPRPLRWLAIAYIEVFRGTSALVQLFWIFFVLPQFGLTIEAFPAAVLCLGLNGGAYGAEIVRGALGAVPATQWEAAAALNMSRPLTLGRIILPQALAAMIPPMGNLFIELLKATSLVSLITLGDLTFRARQLDQATMETGRIFLLVLLGYLALSLGLTLAMRLAERGVAPPAGRRA